MDDLPFAFTLHKKLLKLVILVIVYSEKYALYKIGAKPEKNNQKGAYKGVRFLNYRRTKVSKEVKLKPKQIDQFLLMLRSLE